MNLQSRESVHELFKPFLVHDANVHTVDMRDSCHDYIDNISVFRIPKSKFPTAQSFIDMAYYKADNLPDSNKDTRNLFKDDSHRIPTYSPYDCTGQVCGVNRYVSIFSHKYLEYHMVTVIDRAHLDL